ncbi:MAG: type II toxin-antitoxin system HicA family toxin [Anaerovoracaceae bacterium]
MSKQYSVRELQHLLKANGFTEIRTKGSHQIWKKGETTIPLPVVTLNYKLAIKIAKQCSC